MKKILIIFFFGLAAIGCSKDDETASPVVTDTNNLKVINYPSNSEIKDGDVLAFNHIGPIQGNLDANALKFYFKNISSSDMKVKMRLISKTGVPDTNGVSFCYGPNINDGVCLSPGFLVIGNVYPRNNEAQIIVPANGIAGSGGANKIINTSAPVAPATAVEYIFEAFQQDANGSEVGNKVRFTYRYQQ